MPSYLIGMQRTNTDYAASDTYSVQETVYQQLTGEDEGRVCKDIPEDACNDQPGNFLKHVLSLGATKTGDGLADPKLVLSWLLTSLGAPTYLIGLLVPVREAGALLPQLITAGSIRSLPLRKWAWAAGSLFQGLAVLGMAASAWLLDGASAGWAIVGLLALFALARSVCSVSYKDVLGKTVSKSTRGTATGTASTIAAALVLIFGLLLSLGIIDKSIPTIVFALTVAGGLWLLAAALFSSLKETPGATEGGGNALTVAIQQISLLKRDRQLVRFIVTRALLTSTALAPPYYLALTGTTRTGELGDLGPFVVASGLAAVVSTYVWGRLSDVSSRRVLIKSAVAGTVALGAITIIALFFDSLLNSAYLIPAIHFGLMIAYQGVRLGRSTHIVDMADPDTRAAYTALSNTIIGIVLVIAGAFGALAQLAGEAAVLAAFAVMSALAAVAAAGLREVQEG